MIKKHPAGQSQFNFVTMSLLTRNFRDIELKLDCIANLLFGQILDVVENRWCFDLRIEVELQGSLII